MDNKKAELENAIVSLYKELIIFMLKKANSSNIGIDILVRKIINNYKNDFINREHEVAAILLRDTDVDSKGHYFESDKNVIRIIRTINRRTRTQVEYRPPRNGSSLVEEVKALLTIVEEKFSPVNKEEFKKFKEEKLGEAKNIAKEMDGLRQDTLEMKGSLSERLGRLEDEVARLSKIIEMGDRKW